ncbi:MAG TPA: sodium:solute symporter [Blastocatellia bacterium]
MGFSAVDYAVLVIYLAGITVFGTLFKRSQRTVKDYFLGNRNVSWVVISLSIVATETSTLTLIGVPALAYAQYARPEDGGNFTYLQVLVGYIIGRILIGFLFIPAYFRGELCTAYQLLERRFGSGAKHLAASLFLIMRGLAEGVRVFAASLVLGAILGASFPGVRGLWFWSIAIVGALTLIYTYEGGISAVIWTDLVQFVIYIGGALLAAVEIVRLTPGGWQSIAAVGEAAGKFRVLSLSLNPSLPFTFWAGILGGTVFTLGSHGTDQLIVQRLLACRSASDARKALTLSGFVVLIQFTLVLTIGVMLFGYHHLYPPLLVLTTNDSVFPTFIVEHLPHGLSGLMIAALLAAAMSNLSGSLNSLSSTTLVDFYQPLWGSAKSEKELLRLSRILTAVWGLSLAAIAVVARGWGSVFTAGLTIASIVYGPMLGSFLLGVLTKRATEMGVIAGMSISLVLMIGIKLFTPIAWTWYVLVGSAACVSTGYSVSLLFRPVRSPRPDDNGSLSPSEPLIAIAGEESEG